MRLAILSRRPTLYSTRRFVETAKRTNRKTVVLDPLHCMLVTGPAGPAIIHHGKKLHDIAVALPRIGSSITEHGLAVVRQFEAAGVPTVNSALAINVSRDKWRTLQALTERGVAVPTSVLARMPQDLESAVELLGGPPFIVKKVQGAQGVGVMLVESVGGLSSILETLWGLGQNVLVQRYVAECQGSDVRVIVVGDKVIGGMRRQARAGEFRANIHRGGGGEPIDLPASYREAALKAMAATGLSVGGVDLLESADGPLVLEVNSSPGFEGLEQATGADIAGLILDYAYGLVAARAKP